MQEFKEYLGDAVYADFDGWFVVLTTGYGLKETNRICLEPDVMEAFLAWIIRLKDTAAGETKP